MSREHEGTTAAGSYGQKISAIEGLLGDQIRDIIPPQASLPQVPLLAVLSYMILATFTAFAREDFVNVDFCLQHNVQ